MWTYDGFSSVIASLIPVLEGLSARTEIFRDSNEPLTKKEAHRLITDPVTVSRLQDDIKAGLSATKGVEISEYLSDVFSLASGHKVKISPEIGQKALNEALENHYLASLNRNGEKETDATRKIREIGFLNPAWPYREAGTMRDPFSPLVVFSRGDLTALTEKPILLGIGSRNDLPAEDMKFFSAVVSSMVKDYGYHTLSGNAKGSDQAAERAAFKSGGTITAAMGVNLNKVYVDKSASEEEKRETYRLAEEAMYGKGNSALSLLMKDIYDPRVFTVRDRALQALLVPAGERQGLPSIVFAGPAEKESGTRHAVEYATRLGRAVMFIAPRRSHGKQGLALSYISAINTLNVGYIGDVKEVGEMIKHFKNFKSIEEKEISRERARER